MEVEDSVFDNCNVDWETVELKSIPVPLPTLSLRRSTFFNLGATGHLAEQSVGETRARAEPRMVDVAALMLRIACVARRCRPDDWQRRQDFDVWTLTVAMPWQPS